MRSAGLEISEIPGIDALVSVCSRNTNVLWFGHGCSKTRMLFEHERNYALGMDALVTVCPWDMNAFYC